MCLILLYQPSVIEKYRDKEGEDIFKQLLDNTERVRARDRPQKEWDVPCQEGNVGINGRHRVEFIYGQFRVVTQDVEVGIKINGEYLNPPGSCGTREFNETAEYLQRQSSENAFGTKLTHKVKQIKPNGKQPIGEAALKPRLWSNRRGGGA